MNIVEFIFILRKNLFYILFFPALLATIVFFLTRNTPLEYKTSTLLYTGVVSGYDISSPEGTKMDYNTTTNAFDNLTSLVKLREVCDETSIRLLAYNLMDNSPNVSKNAHDDALKLVPANLVSKLVDKSSFQKTFINIREYKNGSAKNPIKKLLSSNNPFYSVSIIQSKVQATRKSASDIIEITFTSLDPSVCYNSLKLLSQVMIEKYNNLKTAETEQVVKYFEEKAIEAQQKMEIAENNIIDFGIKNKIINLEEQTKTITTSKASVKEKIEKDEITLASCSATAKNLDEKLNMRNGLLESNSNIVAKRQKLANLNYKISNSEIYGLSDKDLEKNRAEAEALKQELKEMVNDIYRRNNTQEGLQGSMLLQQWLNNVLTIDECNSRLIILRKQLKEFDSTFDQYAPLSSMLGRLQREQSIAEKEYLNVLQALNESKLRYQNIQYSSNLKVIDAPSYPSAPTINKNVLLVIASFVIGVFLLAGYYIAIDLLDSSIKTPKRAEEFSNLKVIGSFPSLLNPKKTIDIDKFESDILEQITSSLMLQFTENKNKEAKLITISSLHKQDGKTWCATRIAKKLSETGSTLVMSISAKNEDVESESPSNQIVNFAHYHFAHNTLDKKDLFALTTDKVNSLGRFKYVIIEVPALSENQIPIELLRNSDVSLLVVDAEKTWRDVDTNLIELFKKATSDKQAMVLLNKVSILKLEAIFGFIPQKKKGKFIKPKKEYASSNDHKESEKKKAGKTTAKASNF